MQIYPLIRIIIQKKLQSINFFRLFNAKLKFGKHIHYLRISPLFVIKKKSDILHTHRI